VTTNVVMMDGERTPKEMRAVIKRRKYQHARYARLKRQGKLKMQSKRVPKKARNAARNKKRRGLPVAPVKRTPPKRTEAQTILAARAAEAIALLREATRCLCPSCGSSQPRKTKPQLLTQLAQLELEEG
jgi:hypothetical protein